MLSVAKLISSAASSLQSGNPLLKVYQLDENTRCHGGPYLKWQAIQARHFERHEEVTLFLFDKKLADKLSKREQELLYDLLKADAGNLQRLRHPIILPILEPLNEDKTSLAFATKPTSMTLYGLLKGTKTRPSVLEMKYGLLDTCEALAFLHQDAKMAHLAVSPFSIFISRSGRWALGCLGHSKQVNNSNLIETQITFDRVGGHGASVEFSLDPPLAYSAPEMTAHHPARCGLPSDVYSLGLVAYEVLSEGTRPLLVNVGYDTSAHRSQCKSVLPLPRGANLPTGAEEMLRTMLALDPSRRPTIAEVLQSPFFQDINVKALRFIVALREKDASQKTQFLRGLRKLLEEQSDLQDERVLRLRVLEPLLDFLCEISLCPALLPNIVFIIKKVGTPLYFQDVVWPKLQPLFSAREIQIDCVLQLIDELPMLVEFGGDAIIKSDLVPFALKCLQIQEAHIQQALFTSLPVFGKKFDYMILRTGVLPRMLTVVVETESSSVRACGIRAAIEISDNFDRATLLDQIIPMMEKVVRADRSPLVSASLRYGVDKLIKRLGNKLAAERILPLLTRLLGEENLPQPEFDAVMQLTLDILNQVKCARSKEFANQTERSISVNEALGNTQTSSAVSAGGGRGLESLLFDGPRPVHSAGTHNQHPLKGANRRSSSRSHQLDTSAASKSPPAVQSSSLLDLSVAPLATPPTALHPTALHPTALHPTALQPTALLPSGVSSSSALQQANIDIFAGLIEPVPSAYRPTAQYSTATAHTAAQGTHTAHTAAQGTHTAHTAAQRTYTAHTAAQSTYTAHTANAAQGTYMAPAQGMGQLQYSTSQPHTADPFSSLANFSAPQQGSVAGGMHTTGTDTQNSSVSSDAWTSAFAGLDKALADERTGGVPVVNGATSGWDGDDLNLLM